MLKLLARLGQDPQRSLAIFLRGLGLFCFGAILIVIGYYNHHVWQILGLIILFFACFIAAWGYLGVFANRWFNILNKNKK